MPARSAARVVLAILVLAVVSGACSPGPNASDLASLLATGSTAPLPGSVAPSGSANPSGSGASARPSGSPVPSAPSPSPSSPFIVHVVARGESLTSIARAFNTTPRSVAYWNRETYPTLDPDSPKYAPNKIEIGWKLRLIPGVTLEDQGPLPSRRSAVPIPSGSRPPPPSTPADGSARLVANGDRRSNEVALTFNLGGDLEPTLDVIDWLIDNDVRATLAINGQSASTSDAGRRALELIGAHPDLFGLINYSWDGVAYTDLTDAQIQDSLRLAEDAVTTALGRPMKPLFRPPLGAQDAHVRAAAGTAGWPYMIMWDIDTLDAKPPDEGGPTADDITAKVLSRVQGGSIVLLHVGGYHTAEALPQMVDGLRSRGFEPVTIGDLLNL